VLNTVCAVQYLAQSYSHRGPSSHLRYCFGVIYWFCVLQGFVLVAFGANVLFYGLFYAGRAIARVLQGSSKDKEE